MDPVATGVLGAATGAAAAYLVALLTVRRRAPQETSSEPERRNDTRDASLERLVGVVPAPMLLVDRQGRVRTMNQAAGEIFETNAQRAGGRALIEVVGSVELERLVQRALGGDSAEAALVFRGFSGERHLFASAMLMDESSSDILVFVQDRSKLADLERVRRDFLADISHELRTPISSIRLMVETIQLSGEDPEAIRIFLPKVVVELERMTRMIEDLLALARGESKQVPLHREKVDLSTLISDTLTSFRQRAEQQDVQLRIDSKPNVEAEVDAERIRQVVANLVDNALRHTPAGGHVRIGLSAGNGDATLHVEDDGVGIPFKDLPHVFERFYVVDRSRSRDSGGTGLGLAIVKQIVEAHGGSVRVDSELGSGATFQCTLPVNAPTTRS